MNPCRVGEHPGNNWNALERLSLKATAGVKPPKGKLLDKAFNFLIKDRQH